MMSPLVRSGQKMLDPFPLLIVFPCEGDKEVSWIAPAQNHSLLPSLFQLIHKY